ncbi:uncharacterized protein LOC111873322 isoform X2 [Cryptotermes secundus]|uniref:uncharacterized protein LOC111873322 isoform X2 n=1 Tax=Cryptotermes secundus TaxID=105785 RepID=UPI000CD7CBBB|nr:uncharacterized protein LOC111873322 isoform X2 [Cryptotermes secundus]XP_023723716.1 uncharacterized protein LOC111873322 isoform X2 [Cryptotermes secundus]XP_023723717.1 uncharacterized protein LOC111873322 isoform X2 [Cryptotermes secundus]XP_033610945.1 uncharacterized protein LOC111873322 isoform X2 [Cryptotermes secundus]
MTTASSMQAALYVREKQKQRRKKIRRGRIELPSNVATKEIAPFPRYPPNQWGKAAWHEKDRERKTSLTEAAVNHRIKATEAHRRWMRKNRINDSSFGGSSLNGRSYAGGVFQAANTLLYVGLGTSAFGLILSGLGTGDKGFQTYALRLMGPALFLSGLLCCLLSVLLCVCPSKCCRCHRQRHIHKNSLKCHINNHKQLPSTQHFNHHSLLGAVKSDSKEPKRTEDIPMADQTKLLQKSVEGNNRKTVCIVTTPLETATVSNVPVPSGSSGHISYQQQKQQQQHQQPQHCQQHQQQIPQNIVSTTLLFLQHEQKCSSFSNNFQPLQTPAINIPNFITSSSDEEDILGSTHLLENSIRKDSNFLDLEMRQLDSSSFDFSSFENSNDREGILRIGRAKSADTCGRYRESDKRRTPLNSVFRNDGATLMTSKAVIETTSTCSPSSRIGLVNPDPDAHELEGMLLLDEEFQPSSAISKDLDNLTFSVAVSSSSSPGRHTDIDNLLQNEIVLSPSKLQQTTRK